MSILPKGPHITYSEYKELETVKKQKEIFPISKFFRHIQINKPNTNE